MADRSWIDDLIEQYTAMTRGLSGFDDHGQLEAIKEAYSKGDYLGLQGLLSGPGFNVSPEQEKWLDNMVAAQNTQSARNFEEHMGSTDILRAGAQLESLGLSRSGVLQTGGSGTNGVAAADNVKSNVALDRYNQKMQLARQLLSMTSSMASAGVYGHAIGAAKKASSVLTSAASHSAYKVLKGSQRWSGKEIRTGGEPGLTPDEEWWNN